MIQEKIKYLCLWGNQIESTLRRSKGDYEGLSKAQINLLVAMKKSHQTNPWFTEVMVRKAFQGVLHFLNEGNLTTWLKDKQFSKTGKNIGIVAAGNIPMVAFHDVLCVLVSNHTALIKCSSEDALLIPALLDLLYDIQPVFEERVKVVNRLQGMDAVIATGSNNTARYFEHYFGKYPNIIRKSRTSIAVLSGKETEEELKRFSSDLFDYYGLGCRNVNFLFLPKDFDKSFFIEGVMPTSEWVNNSRYMNNLDYNKSIYLINRVPFLDGGRFLMTESDKLFSPISVLHYQTYEHPDEITAFIESNKEEIQCVVDSKRPNCLTFGYTQLPELDDYADGVDVLAFLEEL